MPIIYTPTVGLACERFSHIIRRPRGLFIAYPERDDIDTILENAASPQVEVIVVTDGERILGLGDQGAGGMGIPIGKLSIYTACGGIHPATTLPILLDPGTNNRERLDDPLYIGWRHERITGAEYDAFVDAFVQAVKRKFPGVLLQWEDFAQHNANRLLERYRDQLCTFNDDIQGTAAVTTGALLAAVAVTGRPLRDHTVAILGAGSAGCGIAEQLVAAMVEEGLPEAEARSRFFLIDRQGLLHDGMDGLLPFQRKLAQPKDRVDRLATGRGQADRAARRDRARASDDPDRRLGPAAHLHRGGDPRDGPIRRAADHLPALEPDLAGRGDPRRADRLDRRPRPDRHRQPVRRRRVRRPALPDRPVQQQLRLPGRGPGRARCPGAAGQRRDVHGGRPRPGRHRPGAPRPGRRPAARRSPTRGGVARTIAIAVADAARREGLAESGHSEDLERLVDGKMWGPEYRPMRRKPLSSTSRMRRWDQLLSDTSLAIPESRVHDQLLAGMVWAGSFVPIFVWILSSSMPPSTFNFAWPVAGGPVLVAAVLLPLAGPAPREGLSYALEPADHPALSGGIPRSRCPCRSFSNCANPSGTT